LIPGAASERPLNTFDTLSFMPKVQAADAIAFVRAARLYQEALWVAEAELSLAWLLLVSSVESAANQWRKGRGSAVERLVAEKPDFILYLQSCGVNDLVERVANEFSDTLGSTKKFVDSLLTHLPPPPVKRPKWGLVSWQPTDLDKAFRLVYKYRSKALHEGIPFPAPMCEPGIAVPNSDASSETPAGLAASTLGGVWKVEDTPMLLHVFEYIGRSAILSWWKSLKAEATV
jgi:hypothetical protein